MQFLAFLRCSGIRLKNTNDVGFALIRDFAYHRGRLGRAGQDYPITLQVPVAN